MQVKYEIDKDTGLLVVDRVLYSSMEYPHNYGASQAAVCVRWLPTFASSVNSIAVCQGHRIVMLHAFSGHYAVLCCTDTSDVQHAHWLAGFIPRTLCDDGDALVCLTAAAAFIMHGAGD